MGAPRANTNALKHGIFRKVISPEERAGLRKMPTDDLRPEINMLRVAIKNVFKIHTELLRLVEELFAYKTAL